MPDSAPPLLLQSRDFAVSESSSANTELPLSDGLSNDSAAVQLAVGNGLLPPPILQVSASDIGIAARQASAHTPPPAPPKGAPSTFASTGSPLPPGAVPPSFADATVEVVPQDPVPADPGVLDETNSYLATWGNNDGVPGQRIPLPPDTALWEDYWTEYMKVRQVKADWSDWHYFLRGELVSIEDEFQGAAEQLGPKMVKLSNWFEKWGGPESPAYRTLLGGQNDRRTSPRRGIVITSSSPIIEHDYGLSHKAIKAVRHYIWQRDIGTPALQILDEEAGKKKTGFITGTFTLLLSQLEGSMVKRWWFRPFLTRMLSQFDTRVICFQRVPGYFNFYNIDGNHFWHDLRVNAITALYLMRRTDDDIPAEQFLLEHAGDVITQDLRRARLGAMIGEQTIERYAFGLTCGLRGYELDLKALKVCHNLLVTYLHIRHSESRRRSKTSAISLDLQVTELFRKINDPYDENIEPNLRFGIADVALLASRKALAYAALIGLLNDVIRDTAAINANREAALAAFSTMTSAGASVGGAMGGAGAQSLAVASVDGIGSFMSTKMSSKHKNSQEALSRIVGAIVDKFNVEVLARADSGWIDGLDPCTPPSDPDLIGITTCTDDLRRAQRPTMADLELFKTTAMNVFVAVCSQEGVGLSKAGDTTQTTLPEVPNIELRENARRMAAAAPAPVDPIVGPPVDRNEEILRAELSKHYPAEDIDDWCVLIRAAAKAVPEQEQAQRNYPRYGYPRAFWTPVNDIYMIQPNWTHVISEFFQDRSPALSGGHLGPYDNWRCGRDTANKLRAKILARTGVEPSRQHIADQVRYFFIDPRVIRPLKELGLPYVYDGILYNAPEITATTPSPVQSDAEEDCEVKIVQLDRQLSAAAASQRQAASDAGSLAAGGSVRSKKSNKVRSRLRSLVPGKRE